MIIETIIIIIIIIIIIQNFIHRLKKKLIIIIVIIIIIIKNTLQAPCSIKVYERNCYSHVLAKENLRHGAQLKTFVLIFPKAHLCGILPMKKI